MGNHHQLYQIMRMSTYCFLIRKTVFASHVIGILAYRFSIIGTILLHMLWLSLHHHGNSCCHSNTRGLTSVKENEGQVFRCRKIQFQWWGVICPSHIHYEAEKYVIWPYLGPVWATSCVLDPLALPAASTYIHYEGLDMSSDLTLGRRGWPCRSQGCCWWPGPCPSSDGDPGWKYASPRHLVLQRNLWTPKSWQQTAK